MNIEVTSNRIIVDGQSYPKGSIRPQYIGNIVQLIFPWWNNIARAGEARWDEIYCNGVLCTSLQDFKDFQEANFYPMTGVPPGVYGVLADTNTWLKAQRGAFNQFTDGPTITLDMEYQNHYGVLAGNRVLGVPSNLAQGQSGVINVWQDDTGSRALAYAWPFEFPDGNVPVLSLGKGTKDQLAYMINKYVALVVTATIATPAVLTCVAHGLFSGMKLQLTTTGALPTGLVINTTYWVHKINDDSFHLSTSFANYQAGTYIATSGVQSGVHTATCISITISKNAIS